MKEQLTIISDDLNHGIITEEEARTKLLILLGVSGSAVCPYCNGDGWTDEHAPHPHPEGDCMGMCPIQVQCPHCEGTGKVMQEVVDKYNEDVKVSEEESDLPF